MARRLAALTAAVLLSAGCGTTEAERAEKAEASLSACQDAARPWIGRGETELFQQLGSPLSSSNDGQSGRVLEYHLEVDLGRERRVAGGGATCLVSLIEGSSMRYTLTLKRDFFVGDGGRIYRATCVEGPTHVRFGG